MQTSTESNRPKHRAGLVGAGYISEYHVAAIRRLKDVELVGVTDLDAAKADALAKRLGVKAYASLAALRDAGADVIHVLTPPNTHASVALAALDLGCHVLVEKPLAVDVEDCDRIERKAREKGLRVCVNHSLLFDPQVRSAIEMVRSGRIGRVVSVDILRSSVYPPNGEGGPLPPQYRSAGYPFRDLGVHALYVMEALLGPIEHVHADYRSIGGDPNLAFDEWRAQVRCRDGMGQFQLSWNVKPLQSQIIIQGTAGVVRVDLFLMYKALRAATAWPKPIERVVNAMGDLLRPLGDVGKGIVGYVRKKVLPYHGLQTLVSEFYGALDAGGPMPASVSDARRIVRWTEQIARAADSEYANRLASMRTSDSVPYLVTGASGGLGREIVRRLRERGSRVRVMVRRIPETIDDGTEVVVGDMGDPAAVDRAVRGARVVIHAGAAMKGPWPEHRRSTVAGTHNVLEACAKFGVARLIHISSLSVLDWAGGDRRDPIDEETAYEPRPEERGSYTQAKLLAEREVIAFCRERGIAAVVLRPGQIFGGAIPLLTPAVGRKKGSRWLVLGDGKMLLPLVHVDDVVDAVLAAANGESRDVSIVHLVHPEQITQNEALRLAIGPEPKVRHIPRGLLMAAGGLSELVLGLLGRKSTLSRYRLRSALSSRRFESERAKELLGWTPRTNLRRAIAAAAGRAAASVAGAGIEPAPRVGRKTAVVT